VTSVGVNPTFGEGPRTVETFILDFAQDIYREPVKLFFVERIREQRKFERIDELTRQMYKDVEDARAIFDRLNMAV
jgi:riboflavin kinase/FMN adenylyltransferase